MTLICLGAAWFIGIATAHTLGPPLAVIVMLAIPPLAGLILWRNDAQVRRIAACGLFLLLGSARYTLSLPDLADPDHFAAYADQGEAIPPGGLAGVPTCATIPFQDCLTR